MLCKQLDPPMPNMVITWLCDTLTVWRLCNVSNPPMRKKLVTRIHHYVILLFLVGMLLLLFAFQSGSSQSSTPASRWLSSRIASTGPTVSLSLDELGN